MRGMMATITISAEAAKERIHEYVQQYLKCRKKNERDQIVNQLVAIINENPAALQAIKGEIENLTKPSSGSPKECLDEFLRRNLPSSLKKRLKTASRLEEMLLDVMGKVLGPNEIYSSRTFFIKSLIDEIEKEIKHIKNERKFLEGKYRKTPEQLRGDIHLFVSQLEAAVFKNNAPSGEMAWENLKEYSKQMPDDFRKSLEACAKENPELVSDFKQSPKGRRLVNATQ